MHRSMLKLFARMQVPTRFPQIWSLIRTNFEGVLRENWVSSSGTVPRGTWVTANREQLVLFCEGDDLDTVEEALREEQSVPTQPLARLLENEVGSALYADQSYDMQWSKLLERIAKAVDDLFFHEFAEPEIQSFKARMRVEIANWTKVYGHKPLVKDYVPVTFLGFPMKMAVGNLNDVWNYPFMAAMKSVAVNRLLVPRLPWEIAAFGEKTYIPEVRQTTKIPPALLTDSINARTTLGVITALDWEVADLEGMEKEVLQREETLRDLDRSFVLEKEFLSTVLPKHLEGTVKKAVLDALPAQVLLNPTYKEAVQQVEKVKLSHAFRVLPAAMHREMERVLTFLRSVQEAKGPTAADVATYSDFRKTIAERCGNWATLRVPVSAGSSADEEQVLWGRDCIAQKFRLVEENADKGRTVDLDEVEDLRRFRWLLPGAACAKLDDWVRTAVRKHCAAMGGGIAIQDAPLAVDGANAAAAAASSDGRQVAVIPHAFQPMEPPKKRTKAEEKREATKKAAKDDIKSFFGSKAIWR